LEELTLLGVAQDVFTLGKTLPKVREKTVWVFGPYEGDTSRRKFGQGFSGARLEVLDSFRDLHAQALQSESPKTPQLRTISEHSNLRI